MFRKLSANETALHFGTTPVEIPTDFDVNDELTMDRVNTAVLKGKCADYWPMIGTGRSKDVYALSADYVLKVWARKENQVKLEIDTWERATTEERKGLCPIIAYSPNKVWSIMLRTRYANQTTEDFKAWYRAMQPTSKRLGFYDYHDANVGKLNDQYVVFDYGWSKPD